jgi:hypothetical protein
MLNYEVEQVCGILTKDGGFCVRNANPSSFKQLARGFLGNDTPEPIPPWPDLASRRLLDTCESPRWDPKRRTSPNSS